MSAELFPDRLSKRLGTLSIVSRSGRLGHHKGTHRSSKTGTSLTFPISGNIIRVMICVISTGMSMHERINHSSNSFWMNKK